MLTNALGKKPGLYFSVVMNKRLVCGGSRYRHWKTPISSFQHPLLCKAVVLPSFAFFPVNKFQISKPLSGCPTQTVAPWLWNELQYHAPSGQGHLSPISRPASSWRPNLTESTPSPDLTLSFLLLPFYCYLLLTSSWTLLLYHSLHYCTLTPW